MKKPDYSYQKPLIEKTIKDLKEHGKVVLACAPNAGKTNMALKISHSFFLKNKKFCTLILCHGQVIIREQWVNRIEEMSIPMKYKVIKSSREKNIDMAPINFSLPQTLNKLKTKIKVDLLIVDEAHQRYAASQVQSIIKKFTPKYQLLLTGSPASFIEDGSWKVHGVTLDDLLTHGVATDPHIEIVKFDYNLKDKHYLPDGDVKTTFKFNKKQTFSSMDLLLSELLQKITSKQRVNIDSYKKIDLKTIKWNTVLANMDKTMIVAKNQTQARYISAYFNNLGVQSSLSISDNDKDNGIASFEQFKKNKKCFILIVVSRGILGFDYSELFNIIDMSGTRNVDRLFQLICRIVRKSKRKKNKKKLFIKLTSEEMKEVIYWSMSYVVALSLPEYYYSQKNYKQLRVPVKKDFVEGLRPSFGDSDLHKQPKLKLPRLLTFNEVKNGEDSQRGLLQGVAYTDLGTVKVKVGLQDKIVWTYDSAMAIAKACNSRSELIKNHLGVYAFLMKSYRKQLSEVLESRIGRVSYDEAVNLAKTCRTKIEFSRKHKHAYNVLKRYPIYKTLFEPAVKTMSEKEAIEIAKKCKNLKDFRQNHLPAFNVLYKIGKHGEYVKSDRTIWTLEGAIAEAKKYKNRKQFFRDSGGAADCLKKYPEEFEKVLPNTRARMTKKKAIEIAKTCETRLDLSKKSSAAYNFLIRNHERELNKIIPLNRTVWDYEKSMELAKQCKTRQELAKRSGAALRFLNINHRSELNKIFPLLTVHWTIEKAVSVAKKCKNRSEFSEKYSFAYQLLVKKENRHILDKILPRTTNVYTSVDEMRSIASSFKSRKDLREQKNTVYSRLMKEDKAWLDSALPANTEYKFKKGKSGSPNKQKD